jgi:tetratricopeptide (TPR) repeat protein
VLLLALLTPLFAQTTDPHVVVPPEVLLGEAPPPPELAPAKSVVAWARTTLTPVEGELKVTQELRFEVAKPGWVFVPVLDGRVRLSRVEPGVVMGPDGAWWFIGELKGPRTLRLEGTLPTQADALSLRVIPAVRQQVVPVGDEDLEVLVEGAIDGAVSPRDSLSVRWGPPQAKARSRQEVVQAEVAAAAWLDEDALRVRARAKFLVRRGERSTFNIRLPGATPELTVTGANLASWTRQGDLIVITTTAPVKGAFEVGLEWRQPFGAAGASIQLPEPQGVSALTGWLTLGGSAEVLLTPSADARLRTTAISSLPEHARAIGDVAPAAAWTGRGALNVKALQLEALEGPALVVDRARCVQAAAESGKSLLRCSLDVRNDSKQFLRVAPPEGASLWGARVNGEGVTPVRLADDALAVPLERSVETLSGLTTLDVELTFLMEGAPWEHKGEQQLALPSIDADVARVEWELRLPPGYEAELTGGSARLEGVEQASITYASTAATVTASTTFEDQYARDTWNKALQAYQDNDFDTAQAYIDQTLSLDPTYDNALKLQSNLEVLNAPVSGAQAAAAATDEAMTRRVKDMAKAKVADEELRQEQAMWEADQLLNEGRYEEAAEKLEEVVELSKELSRYEQTESVEQSYRSSSSAGKLAEAKKRSKDDSDARRNFESNASSASMGSRAGSFEGEEVADVYEDEALLWDTEFGYVGGEVGGVEGGVLGGLAGGVTGPVLYGASGASGEEALGFAEDLGYLEALGYIDDVPVEEPSPYAQQLLMDVLVTRGDGGVDAPPPDMDYDGVADQMDDYQFDDAEISGALTQPDGEMNGIGGLLGAKGSDAGGLGISGSGRGGGGTAEGLGGLGTTGSGRGASGYGRGGAVAEQAPAKVVISNDRIVITEEESGAAYGGYPASPQAAPSPPPPPPPPPEPEPEAVMVTEDLLERVPAARSYQSVVTSVPGVAVMGGGEVMNGDANMDAEFASRGPEPRQSAPKPMPDPTYMTDGAPVTDPVAGTFSLNFDYNNDEAERARFAPLDSREQNVSGTQDMTRAGVAMSQSEVACRRDGIDGMRCPPFQVLSMSKRAERPPEPRRPQVSALPPEIPGKSGVSATTLAIPLPDHGAAIQVTQSLLSPGESATITVKYRESR